MVQEVFSCRDCGAKFQVPPATLKKFPGWKPKQCTNCRFGKTNGPATTAEALERFDGGPDTGVFTDGACEHNPGPGGWGAVRVNAGEIIAERSGHDPATTNNRMELTALIEAYKLLSLDEEVAVYSDSSYCVSIVNEWAAHWEANGWKRGKKREPVQNLDLVQELYAVSKAHPLAKATWIRGHNGSRWNEYADALSRAYQSGDVPPVHSEAPATPENARLL
jgi:ribonuclease HI